MYQLYYYLIYLYGKFFIIHMSYTSLYLNIQFTMEDYYYPLHFDSKSEMKDFLKA